MSSQKHLPSPDRSFAPLAINTFGQQSRRVFAEGSCDVTSLAVSAGVSQEIKSLLRATVVRMISFAPSTRHIDVMIVAAHSSSGKGARRSSSCNEHRIDDDRSPPQTNRTSSISRDSKINMRSRLALVFGCYRCSGRSFERPEIPSAKNDLTSIAYGFRTKSAQSGGLETDDRRERISGPARCVAVRSFAPRGRGCWRF